MLPTTLPLRPVKSCTNCSTTCGISTTARNLFPMIRSPFRINIHAGKILRSAPSLLPLSPGENGYDCFQRPSADERMDHAPYDFVVNASEQEWSALVGFVHRTFNDSDCINFVGPYDHLFVRPRSNPAHGKPNKSISRP